MGLLGRHFWKFFVGLVALIAVGLAVIYATDYLGAIDTVTGL